jgi:Zn-dependent peptidase ImmA (M78 family)
MPTFDRGFKVWAERTSLALRRELDVGIDEALAPSRLAKHLEILVWTPREVPGLPAEVFTQLLEKDPWGWSALSFQVNGQNLIIYNPRKSKPRQASDISHELAHIILDHKPSTVVLSDTMNVGMRTFDEKQEDEANWLAWCLLLPRESLVYARSRRLSVEEIADLYRVSVPLVNYRMNMTGVNYQFKRIARK